ncbi:pseudouridine synthase [Mycoplasmopsis ciconiae]|uniref:Pseudouridine synthase n=1 Tax=Mycoplasmopsis ciconiae TaxID=561067 RepID=A0ABU7MM51_9BACT|nr:pseudouridine synthase [Mycoplasmopsis ciconiae]
MSDSVRLDKYISHMCNLTRSEIKQLIKARKILVNNQPSKNDSKVNIKSDTVTLNNQVIHYEEFTYYFLNKPQNYVCSRTPQEGSNVFELIISDQRPTLVSYGRLDKDTSGLLIISNDTQTLHKLLNNKKHVQKTYLVEHQKNLTTQDIESLQKGVKLSDGTYTLAAKVQTIDKNHTYLTITEGKYHQIKRMFSAINNKVTNLKRITFSNLNLADFNLNEGEYVKLNDQQIKLLKGEN